MEDTAIPLVTGVFSFNDGKNDRIGVLFNEFNILVLDTNGNKIGTLPFKGDRVTQSKATGNIFVNDGNVISLYDRNGKALLTNFGGDPTDPKSKTHVQGIIIGDQPNADSFFMIARDGMYKIANDGYLIGFIKADIDDVGGHLGYINGSQIEFADGVGYYVQKGTGISKVAVSRLAEIAAAGQSPAGDPFTLGIGTFIDNHASSNPYELYKEGDPVSIDVAFSPWWNNFSSTVTGQYTVRTIDDIRDNKPGKVSTFALPQRDQFD